MFRAKHALVASCLFLGASVASGALLDGLISGWTFDDETVDDIRGRNHGVLRGGAAYAPDRHDGMALDLNGVDSFAEIPHGASMEPMADQLTAAGWVFVRANAQEFPSFMWKGAGMGWGPGYLFQLSIRNPDTTVMQYGSCSQNVEGWFNYRVEALNDGEWHHTATVADGDEINGYFDGEELALLSSYTGGKRPLRVKAPYNVFPDQPIRMGLGQGIGGNAINNPDFLDNKGWIDGMVDDAVIFSRALSQDEILELMESDLSELRAVQFQGKLTVTWAGLKSR